MKIYYALFVYSLLTVAFSATSRGEQMFRTFTARDGRALNAVIKEYNAGNGKIRIEREDGRKLWTSPKVFSEADRQYIRQWIAADLFMTPTKFKIEGVKKKNRIPMHQLDSRSSESPASHESRVEIEYEITMENRTDLPTQDLRIEYRAFILSQDYEGNEESNRVDGGELHIDAIPARGKISIGTKTIYLITQFKTIFEISGSGNSSTSQVKINNEQMGGFWLKVYGSEIDGNIAIRNWCNPSDTSADFVWQEPTSKAPAMVQAKPSEEEKTLLQQARKLRESNPGKALELYLQSYEIAQSPQAADAIGRHYLFFTTPLNVEEGIAWLEKAATNNYAPACSMLTLIYASYRYPEFHDVKKALVYAEKGVFLEPENYSAHHTMAKVYGEDGQYEKAVKCQKQAIRLFRDTSRSRYKEDRYERLLSVLESDMELFKSEKSVYSPSDKPAAGYRAVKLMESDPATAIKLLEENYGKHPHFSIATDIGQAYIWKLDPPDIPLGLEWLEKAAEENSVGACRLLSLVYSSFYGHTEHYNFDKTLEYAQRALSIEPDCYTSLQAMAKAYAIDGQFDKAVEHQTTAIYCLKKQKGTTPEHIADLNAMLERYRNNKM